LLLLIYVGSSGLKHFDSALIGYAVASVFAVAALTYRYTLWLGRPPTWRYFRAGWTNFLSWENFRRYTFLIPKAWWTDILAQTFILRRSRTRWIMHMAIFWGVLLSVMVTFPLTFGWIHFELAENNTDSYTAYFFGFAVFSFPIEAGVGFAVFHILNFTSIILIVGLVIAIWRRLTDAGLLTTQRFGFDLLPIILLMAIAVTGLALTASSLWWNGAFYWFIALVHQVVVVLWLLSLPFGKFFHIVQRPASIGVTLYQTVNQGVRHYGGRPAATEPSPIGTGACRRCNEALPSPQFISDLKCVLTDLGQDYALDEDNVLQDYCPTCKRVLRGQSYYAVMGKRFI
jgi:hypothetical protein